MKVKKRLDVLLTEQGYADTRSKAQAIIMSGQVYVNGQKADKPGVSYEETLAIGDSSSDIEILQACGIGIAMGNANDYVKSQADDICDDVDHDGIYKALKKYQLIWKKWNLRK